MSKFANDIDAAVAQGEDQTTAQEGGAKFEIAAEGPCNLRLVAYVELGKHEKSFQGQTKVQEQVMLTFELSGKNHAPVETANGPQPYRISVTENLSLNEKARFFKLFQLLNYAGKAKHAAQLLGEAFRGRVIHREFTGRNGKPQKIAELYDRKLGAYTITPPRVEAVDEDGNPTGEYRVVKVAPAISEERCFLWNHATREQWDSLFIEGEYPERKNEAGEVIAPARSKNQFQERIRTALNYKGSPIQRLLANGGKELDLPADGVVDDDTPDDQPPAQEKRETHPAAKPKAAAKADPLAGIGDDDDDTSY